MFFLKPFLLVLGGATGIVGFSSLSSLDWDPSNVWRTGSKKKFYLFTCSQRPKDGEEKTGKQWITSDIWIYLTLKDSSSGVTEGTQLQLRGIGSYKKFHHKKLVGSHWNRDEDLHQEIKGTVHSTSQEARFSLTVNKTTGNSRLGESGGGEDAYEYGDMVMCDQQLFKFSNYGTSGEEKYAQLSKVKFSLEKCGNTENNYKGKQGCSIKIDSGDTGLQWAYGFKPIVI
ncbi:hypothetical protein WEN_02775 [Mycoplasma wenyonii str. Massachusetts]|uniref:Uncharacterized protein n=1 Tax=Mycoplasma wenyonii (strain Massachusetts) TaxID=1197325 RepID=I6Z6W8_MYCWM|nr:hypothetical protein [Mycoplasma wenyonii]AFN65338.1 hypothetical protein WEN_02775 [Mycoplasma wenyonii str. Massachusetts]